MALTPYNPSTMFDIPTFHNPVRYPASRRRAFLTALQRFTTLHAPNACFQHYVENGSVHAIRLPDVIDRLPAPANVPDATKRLKKAQAKSPMRSLFESLPPGESVQIPLSGDSHAYQANKIRKNLYEFARYQNRIGAYSAQTRQLDDGSRIITITRNT